jgi:hypothetical protein
VTTQLDGQIGIGKESTYNTLAARTSWLGFTEETLEFKPTFVDGEGMRPGRRTTLQQQRAVGKLEYTGDINFEATAEEPGIVFEAFLGQGQSTKVGPSLTYQHLFTMLADYLPSYSIQKGIPPLGGGALFPYTFGGMQCSALSLDAKVGAILELTSSWVGASLSTSESLDTPTYPSLNELFTYVGGSIMIGGTPSVPTTTALSTGGTAVADIVDASLKFDNAFDSGGFNFGGGGARTRPAAALLGKHTGTLTAEFRDETFWNYFSGNTALGLVLNFQGSLIETSYYKTLQIVLPSIRLEGETPKIKTGDIVTQSIDFSVLQQSTAVMPIYVALRNLNTSY